MLFAFLPLLAKLGPMLASGVGKLFGGGRGGKILDAAGKVAPVLGGAAEARAGAQQNAEAAQLSRDRLEQERYRTGLMAPRTRLGTSTAASLASAGPLRLGAVTPGMGLRGERPFSTGGTSRGLDPQTQQLAQSIMAQQLQEQLSGRGGPPPIAGPPKSGKVDKLLGIGGFAGGILGALGNVFGNRGGGSMNIPNPVIGVGGLPDMTPRYPATIDIGIPKPPLLPSRRIGGRY